MRPGAALRRPAAQVTAVRPMALCSSKACTWATPVANHAALFAYDSLFGMWTPGCCAKFLWSALSCCCAIQLVVRHSQQQPQARHDPPPSMGHVHVGSGRPPATRGTSPGQESTRRPGGRWRGRSTMVGSSGWAWGCARLAAWTGRCGRSTALCATGVPARLPCELVSHS